MLIPKYRAWDEDNNKFWYWDAEYIDSASFWQGVRLHEHIPNKFTGLKDKNGTEIYEGDIVKHKWYEDFGQCGTYHDKQDTVVWHDTKSAFSPFHYFDGYSLSIKTVEVIGNIYQNSELLK